MKSLQAFNNDKDTKENVKAYLVDFLEKEAVKMVFNREDVSAVAEAKDIIDQAFENLDLMFPLKKEEKEIINEAR